MRRWDEEARQGGYNDGDECCALSLIGEEWVDEGEGVGEEWDRDDQVNASLNFSGYCILFLFEIRIAQFLSHVIIWNNYIRLWFILLAELQQKNMWLEIERRDIMKKEIK